jgi:hypothetical protein
LRLDPTLKDNERYKYLVERLVPRPRNPQENIQTGTTKDEAGSHKQEKSIVQVDNQNATKAQSYAPIPLKEVEQIEVQSAIAHQENKRESTEAPPVAQENDVHMKDNTNEVGAIGDDVAMCGTLSTLSEQSDGLKWVPPQVTHEFLYPSDEEIVPNPKVSFSKKGLLPDLGKVRKWFKRSNDQVCDGEAASSTAPCLPVTYKNSTASVRPHDGLSPRSYVDLESRLPQDTNSLTSVA